VVSEETGAVSYACNGRLARGISVEELRAFLTSELVTSPTPPREPEERLRAEVMDQANPGPPGLGSPKPNSDEDTRSHSA